MISTLLLLVVAGFVAGVMAGLLGLGGGILFTPVLLLLFQGAGLEQPVLWTVGTSLLANFTTASSSVFKHLQLGNHCLKEGSLLGAFGIFGTVAGRWIVTSSWYNETEFSLFFSAILLYAAWHFFRGEHTASHKTRPNAALTVFQAALIGLAAGAMATLAGVGGGMIIVPALSIVLGWPLLRIVSVSSTAIVWITFSGWMQFVFMASHEAGISGVTLGFIDLGVAAPLVTASYFGARYGVRMFRVLSQRVLQWSFGTLVLLVALRLLYGLI